MSRARTLSGVRSEKKVCDAIRAFNAAQKHWTYADLAQETGMSRASLAGVVLRLRAYGRLRPAPVTVVVEGLVVADSEG